MLAKNLALGLLALAPAALAAKNYGGDIADVKVLQVSTAHPLADESDS